MDILAATYKNIGPFVDDLMTVRFAAGTYLIAAPIGTGKSFLFFDGPVYGLYKHQRRPILNRAANEGYVQVVFTVADQTWLIERNITPTKQGGESVRSRLFSCTRSAEEREEKLHELCGDEQIVADLNLRQETEGWLEEIEFHSQRELDQAVLDLLPAKEAVLSINFLLQDAPNVFELTPAERVKIFKHLFGLLGIDEAKETLAEKKRELKATINVKEDTKQLDRKLRSQVTEIKEKMQEMRQLGRENDQLQDYYTRLTQHSFLDDIQLIDRDLHIDKLSIDSFDQQLVDEIESDYEDLLARYNKLKGGVDQLNAQINQGKKQITDLKEQVARNKKKQKKIEASLDSTRADEKEKLVEKKAALVDQREALTKQIDTNQLRQAGIEVTDLEELIELKNDYQQDHSLKSSKRDHLRDQYRSVDKQYKKLQTDLEEKQEQLSKLAQQFDEKQKFYCKLIEDNCPFLEKIKDDSESMQVLQEQRALLTKQIKQIQEEQLPELAEEREAKKHQGTKLTRQVKKIQKPLSVLDELDIDTKRQQAKKITTRIEQLDRKIMACEKASKDYDQKKEEVISLKTKIANQQEQLEQLQKEQKALEKRREKQSGSIDKIELKQLSTAADLIQQIANRYEQVQELTQEWTDSKLAIKQLKQKQKRVKRLYKIFSKELLFVVLKDFLPHLEQVINTYLSQLVDYSVRFYLPESADEKMELSIEIHDEKGVREVASLSGGQLMILKLVWILAVGRLMQADFLFLDETINNLDTEAIGRVARLLEDYVSGQQMKFYVVTHSTQIQELDIWDKEIHLA